MKSREAEDWKSLPLPTGPNWHNGDGDGDGDGDGYNETLRKSGKFHPRRPSSLVGKLAHLQFSVEVVSSTLVKAGFLFWFLCVAESVRV